MSFKEELYEQYILSESKTDFIKSLIPESYEHLYFQVLHALNTKPTLSEEDIKVLTKLRNTYVHYKHEGYALHNLDFQNILRILDSQKSTAAQREQALKDLKNYFNIKFNAVKPHQVYNQSANSDSSSAAQQAPQLETSLDQKVISFQNYLNLAYTSHHHLSNIVPQALYKLDVNKLLTDSKTAHNYATILETFVANVPCLHQVKDVPKIYKAIYEDYKSRKHVYDFSQAGYDRLSVSQLKELGTLMKDVVFETKEYQLALIKKLFFRDISKFLSKNSTNLTQEEKAEKKKQYSHIATWAKENLPKKLSYLQRLLTQELVLLNIELGDYNKDLFLEFINNPPTAISVFTATYREQYVKNQAQQDNIWNQVFQFTGVNHSTLQKTVDTYLVHFFRNADTIKPYDTLLDENFLHRTFYRSKILSGQQEYITKAASILSKSEIETLVNQRQITILDSNNRYVKGHDQVKLQVETKNIQNLTVNIFEIKTENYYLQKKSQFDSTISLDGLIPLHTTEYTYKEPANQVILREFNLEPIQKATRGFFIVEFFGNSVSSRAIFKKGLLTIVESPTIAGHLVTIVDESSNICKPTEGGRTGIWMNDRFHAANADGHIVIPYSNSSDTPQTILVHNDFSELEFFTVFTESYHFECTYMYNQESFLQGSKAKIIIRPTLSINSIPANMAVIEEQLIKVSIKNHQDIPTAIEFKDIKFDDKQDIEIEIPIQSIVKSIDIECSGVINKMNGTKQNLLNTNKLTFELHQVPQNQIFNLYLKKTDSLGYVVYALDKSGQPLEKVPIEFQLFHKKVYQNFNSTLQTDAEGKAILGQLENISSITAQVRDYNSFPEVHQNWTIMRNFKVELPSEIVITEEETIEVPLPQEIELNRENVTFYSVNQENSQEFVYEDLFEKVKLNSGFLSISGLKQGSYVLHILELQSYITIKVFHGKYWAHNTSFLITDNTFIAVDKSREKLVSIRETLLVPQSEKEADVLINLNLPKNMTEAQRKRLRVHVFAYNFLSNEQDNFVQSLRNNRVHKPLPRVDVQSTPASFFNNKKIGDEICYVYNRKNEQKRIGNTLEKPCVLLKRTFNRDTTFEKENLDKGNDYTSASFGGKELKVGSMMKGARMQKMMCERADIAVCPPGAYHVKGEIDTFLNFLSHPCFVTSNHLVSQDGSVNIPGLEWKNYASIQVVVSSNNVAISDIFPTTSEKTTTQDLRHQSSMKSDQFYTENFSAGRLNATQSLQISADSQTAVVGSIPEIFEIQKQLMKTGRRTDEYQGRGYSTWQFLKEWNTFTDRQKLDKYNEYASHEVNVFLYFKDTHFFKAVVEPFLRNKMQKTFIDFFLLNNKEEQLKFANTERVNELNVLEKTLLILTLVKNNLKQRAECLASSIENVQKTQPRNIDLQKRLFLTIIESSAKDEIAVARKQLEKMSEASYSCAPEVLMACSAPMSKMALRSTTNGKMNMMAQEESCLDMLDECGDFDGQFESNLLEQRKQFKEGYKKLEKTVEYIERQYYGDNQVNNYSNLVRVNKFWSDLARYIVNNGTIENFVSENFVYAFNNHVEAIGVLALMDVSFSVRDNYDLNSLPGRKIQVLSRKNVIYFSKEIVQSSEISKANVSIIQTFFDPNDRFTTLKDDTSIKIEKEVEEFVINKIYGCKVIISNISIANLNLSVLTEIPEGSIPVNNFEYTKSIDVSVDSYQTYNNIEFFFYFPKPGTFSIYRSNASRNGIIVAQANEIPPIVVKQFHEIKKMENLSDILNNGSKEDILKFAKTQNLQDNQAFNISRILYIIQGDKAFFLSFLEILREQGIFNRNVWEYSLHHNYEQGVLELLNNTEFRKNRMVQQYHKVQSHHSDFLSYDNFSVFEYHPLLTSRVHSFMDQNKSKILNVQFKQTYFEYVNYLSHVSHLTSNHYLVLSYYLILQERIDEALHTFSKIKETELVNSAKIQYDYFAAYLDIYTGGPNFKRAREISQAYLEYPIISWRNLFVNLQNQLSEYDGEVLDESEIADNTDLSKNLKNAEKEQSVSFEIQGKQLIVYYQNAEKAEINLYQLDIEVLFSTQPFMQGSDRNEFTFIKPNDTIKLTFEKLNTLEKKVIDIPQAFSNKNLYIQLVSSTGVQNLSYFSSSLKVQMIEKFGQVKVLDETNAALQKVYVKCFAKHKDDTVAFFRDGYTDLRGRFDYALSSGTDINQVKEFSILICSEEHGSVIRQAKPPTTTGRMETTVSLLKKK